MVLSGCVCGLRLCMSVYVGVPLGFEICKTQISISVLEVIVLAHLCYLCHTAFIAFSLGYGCLFIYFFYFITFIYHRTHTLSFFTKHFLVHQFVHIFHVFYFLYHGVPCTMFYVVFRDSYPVFISEHRDTEQAVLVFSLTLSLNGPAER